MHTWWAQEDKGGGVLGAIGSHMLDSLRFLLDATLESVSCTLRSIVTELPDAVDAKVQRPVTSDDYCSMGLKLKVPARDGGERAVDARVTLAFAGTDAMIKVSPTASRCRGHFCLFICYPGVFCRVGDL